MHTSFKRKSRDTRDNADFYHCVTLYWLDVNFYVDHTQCFQTLTIIQFTWALILSLILYYVLLIQSGHNWDAELQN